MMKKNILFSLVFVFVLLNFTCAQAITLDWSWRYIADEIVDETPEYIVLAVDPTEIITLSAVITNSPESNVNLENGWMGRAAGTFTPGGWYTGYYDFQWSVGWDYLNSLIIAPGESAIVEWISLTPKEENLPVPGMTFSLVNSNLYYNVTGTRWVDKDVKILIQETPIPEPGTFLLLFSGLLGTGLLIKLRRKI